MTDYIFLNYRQHENANLAGYVVNLVVDGELVPQSLHGNYFGAIEEALTLGQEWQCAVYEEAPNGQWQRLNAADRITPLDEVLSR